MIEVDSGALRPLADPLPSLSLSLPEEAWTGENDTTAADWVNQCLTSDFQPGSSIDIDSLLSSMTRTEAAVMEEDPADKGESVRPPQPVSPMSPASSSDGSSHRSPNPLPRHKRASHKRAEVKRREKIKAGLDDLKAEVPKISRKEKLSEPTILSEAAEYTKHLKAQCEKNRTEAGNLRREIESLSSEIHKFQEGLPAAGLKPEKAQAQDSLDQLYKSYVASSTKDNWKFYLFSFFIKPLFESFKREVAAQSSSDFVESVSNWSAKSLSLSSLRHQTLHQMRDITRETNIMSRPEALPEEARASVQRMCADIPPAASVTCTSTPPSAVSQHQASSVTCTSTPPSAVSQHLASSVTCTSTPPSAVSQHQASSLAATNSRRQLMKSARRQDHHMPALDSKIPRQSAILPKEGTFLMTVCGQQTLSETKNLPVMSLAPASAQAATSNSVSAGNCATAGSALPVSSWSADTLLSDSRVSFPALHLAEGDSVLTIDLPSAEVPTAPVSSVTQLLSGFDCQDYDYDITCIPIPDLAVTNIDLLSPQPLIGSVPTVTTSFQNFL